MFPDARKGADKRFAQIRAKPDGMSGRYSAVSWISSAVAWIEMVILASLASSRV